MFQMNCTSVFGFLPHRSAMPADLALPLYLSGEELCCRRVPRLVEPLRPCLLRCSNLQVTPRPPRSRHAGENEELGKAKKQVSFADHKGQALTTVKVFSEFEDPIDIPCNISEFLSPMVSPVPDEGRLVLDFAQPSSDYVEFRQRLDRERVCLEHCVLKERSLAGTVKVKNLSFEKSVKIRITFDTWKSHEDVECQFVRDTYGASDRDTFSFEVAIPEQLHPHKRVEFAVSYEVAGCTYWDSNHGQNYRIIQSALKNTAPSGHQGLGLDQLGIHFDRYGSPRCSHGIFPEWPSYAGYQEIGPYY
ncbi:protein phosphatase 1 regulatory subunit 3B isoform X1 [Brienomyrus brachyistius]|uniref:protein phosphatase 1 regulatory subunit 3B isoform X1 n=1 Tax=Brienomyrus brachyistius TaxID=42636 RepID=UPI0020B40CA1|nr:protein phosphatase 1 regulatory subunit 3B isoform X1 [Brienomyrus brachyistius]